MLPLSLGLALMSLLVAPPPAEPEAPPLALPRISAMLTVSIDEAGNATLSFNLGRPKPIHMSSKEVEQALARVFDAPLTDARGQAVPTPNWNVFTFSARIPHAFPPENGRIEGELDLVPLAKLVRPQGARTLTVYVTQIPSNPTQSILRSRYRTETKQAEIDCDQPHSFVFEFGMHGAQRLRDGLILVALFFVPLGVVYVKRRIALAQASSGPALAWYRFWRWLHWITLATWVVWLTAVPAFEFDALFRHLWPSSIGGVVSSNLMLMLLPPWLITTACAAMAQDLHLRLSQPDAVPGTLLRRALGSVFTILLPILVALVGLFSMLEGRYRMGVLWMGGALALRWAASRWLRRGQDLIPYLVTEGPLHDRIRELAKLAGAPLQQLFVVPSGKMPEANAFAAPGGTVMLTEHLLRNLDRREIDAVAAHELGHLKYRHLGWLAPILIAAILLSAMFRGMLFSGGLPPLVRHAPLGLVVALIAYYFILRRFEFQTDSYAAWLTGDPEAQITSLVKLHRLGLMPMEWGKWEEGMLTHPSTSLRLESIARQNGISRRRLQDLLEGTEQRGDLYPFPEQVAASDGIFTTAFRQQVSTRVGRLLLLGILVPPALVATITWWSGVEGTARWGLLTTGVGLTFAVYLAMQNSLPLGGYPLLRRRLAELLAAEGIAPQAWEGVFVSFAPDPAPRLYETYTNWDIGYLFLVGDRLCYVGERTRFALRRDQIRDLNSGRSMPRWWPVPSIYIHWEDREGGTSGTFNFRNGHGSSMRQMGHTTRELFARLQRWWKSPPATEPVDVESPLAALGPPPVLDVPSIPIRAILNPVGLVWNTGFVALFGLALAFLLGLPFDAAHGRLGWYVPAVACGINLFGMLPIVFYREPKHRE